MAIQSTLLASENGRLDCKAAQYLFEMKKFFLVCTAFLMSISTMLAVPPGIYVDSRGNRKALVSDDGRTIYLLDRDGSVKRELSVTSENSDGSFATRDRSTGIEHSANTNAWFRDRGEICLNLKWLRETVTRQ